MSAEKRIARFRSSDFALEGIFAKKEDGSFRDLSNRGKAKGKYKYLADNGDIVVLEQQDKEYFVKKVEEFANEDPGFSREIFTG